MHSHNIGSRNLCNIPILKDNPKFFCYLWLQLLFWSEYWIKKFCSIPKSNYVTICKKCLSLIPLIAAFLIRILPTQFLDISGKKKPRSTNKDFFKNVSRSLTRKVAEVRIHTKSLLLTNTPNFCQFNADL